MPTGRKNKRVSNPVGRSLIKQRFGKRQQNINAATEGLFTVDIDDSAERAAKLKSITERNAMEELLAEVQSTQNDFVVEKQSAVLYDTKSFQNLQEERLARALESQQELYLTQQNEVDIPRRPDWNKGMSAEELNASEKNAFLNWRRKLAQLEEQTGSILTPFEKNLEVWRQLWRVVERSSLVVQIVDARDPLMFRNHDLEKYVKEVDESKTNLLLLNKGDFLTEGQRKSWARYFLKEGIPFLFFSALLEQERLGVAIPTGADSTQTTLSQNNEKERPDDSLLQGQVLLHDSTDSPSASEMQSSISKGSHTQKNMSLPENGHSLLSLTEEADADLSCPNLAYQTCSKATPTNCSGGSIVSEEEKGQIETASRLYNRKELIEFFQRNTPQTTQADGSSVKIVGLVGYPNVGKSSTINALLGQKKVSVAATPGSCE